MIVLRVASLIGLVYSFFVFLRGTVMYLRAEGRTDKSVRGGGMMLMGFILTIALILVLGVTG